MKSKNIVGRKRKKKLEGLINEFKVLLASLSSSESRRNYRLLKKTKALNQTLESLASEK